MEELGIDEFIILNLLFLLEYGDQRWIYPDDLARQKFVIFHGSWWVCSVKVESHSDIDK